MEIPTSKQFTPIEIILPPSSAQSTNNEVNSKAAIYGVIAIAIINVTLYPILLFSLLYYVAGSLHVLVWGPTLFLFVLRYSAFTEMMMLIISGDHVANQTREDEYLLRDKALDMAREAMILNNKLEWAKFNHASQERIQELINDKRVLEAKQRESYFKSRAVISQGHQQYSQPIQEAHTDDNHQIDVFVPDIKEKFLEWLETAYSDCDDMGYPTGKEPWSAKGAWGEKDSAMFKADILPRLKNVDPPIILQSKRHTGNRVRLNLREFPTFSDAENVVLQIL